MSISIARKGAIVTALAAHIAVGGLSSVALAVPAAADSKPAPFGQSVAARGLGLDPLGDLAADTLARLDATRDVSDPDYVAGRDALADGVALRVGLDPLAMRFAWAVADEEHQRALLAGMTQLGVRYRRNSSKPGEGFDCSGLTTYAWGVAGRVLVRQSGGQIRAAAPRTQETAMAGDLVYYPGHVSLWLGVGRGILHSPYPGRTVEVKIQGGNRTLRWGDPTG